MATKDKKKRTIVLPIDVCIYKEFVKSPIKAHEIIQFYYTKYPDFFPKTMEVGYVLNGKTRESKKQKGFQMRKIITGGRTYQIRPSFMLPYCKGEVSEASKGLFLLKFGVPFWALAFVFGHNAMWWYRLFISLGNNDIVGTSIYKPSDLPKDLIADEHHIRVKGKKKYVATTVGKNCFLGMEVCDSASEDGLTEGYSVFKAEAQRLEASYEPNSVNTDGWAATQKSWQKLFPKIVVIECFLHAFLKVRDRATKKLKDFFEIAGDKIWDCYRAESKRALSQQIRRLREWTIVNVVNCPMKDNILKLCTKKERWMKHIDNINAHRTSNMLDRLMRIMKKHKINSQMFHSTTEVTTKNFRALALLYNFVPSCPAVWQEQPELKSPAARLNQKNYAKDWLENLLISAAKHHFRHHSNPL